MHVPVGNGRQQRAHETVTDSALSVTIVTDNCASLCPAANDTTAS